MTQAQSGIYALGLSILLSVIGFQGSLILQPYIIQRHYHSWLVAAIAPFALTRDFVRRFDFAHLATGRVLLLDCTAAIIQLSLLAWLGASSHMSATGA